jgi:hypothetical protein
VFGYKTTSLTSLGIGDGAAMSALAAGFAEWSPYNHMIACDNERGRTFKVMLGSYLFTT